MSAKNDNAKKKAKAARKAASKKYFDEKHALQKHSTPEISAGKKVVLICVSLALILSVTLPALSQIGIFS